MKIGFRHTMFIVLLMLFLCSVYPIIFSHAETLFLSVDGGSKWVKISQDYNIVSFTISKVNSSIWGLTKEGYILYSTDQGKNWIKKGKLPESIKKDSYYAYIVFSEKYNTLFAGAWRVGLFKSENLGISWEKLKVKSITTLEIEQNSGEIYAGSWGTVLKSIDNGNTWEEFKPWIGGQWIADIAISPLDKKKVYLGLYGTIAKTDNGGKIWITSQDKFGHNDFGGFQISYIILSSKKESLLYAICGLGIFYSRDDGAKWEPLLKFEEWTSYYAFCISDSKENVIFVSKDCEFLKSENHGKTWQIQKNPFGGECARKIIIDSSTQKGAIYVLTWLEVDV